MNLLLVQVPFYIYCLACTIPLDRRQAFTSFKGLAPSPCSSLGQVLGYVPYLHHANATLPSGCLNVMK